MPKRAACVTECVINLDLQEWDPQQLEFTCGISVRSLCDPTT